MVAVYLGETDENRINQMSFDFFDSVLSALGKKINYDAVVNYAGNSYFEKSWQVITENNPMNKGKGTQDKTGIAHALKSLGIKDIQIVN